MSKYEKGTNNHFRSIGNEKMSKKHKQSVKPLRPLDSITMEFGSQSQKGYLSRFILEELLDKMGLKGYFEVKYEDGTRRLYLVGKKDKSYVGENYMEIPMKALNSLSEIICEELDSRDGFIYVKVYKRKRKNHIYILVDPDMKQLMKYNSIDSKEKTVIAASMLGYVAYDDEYASQRDFDAYWNDDDEDGYADDFEDWDDEDGYADDFEDWDGEDGYTDGF